MGFWIYMLIMDMLLPTTMLLIGKAFCKRTPKEINCFYGYRTPKSMKSKDTWEFAHRYCGRIWFIGGIILLPISVIAMLCVLGKSTDTIGFVGAINLVLPMAVIFISIIMTEIALKKKFF